jgi:hypothetical protein
LAGRLGIRDAFPKSTPDPSFIRAGEHLPPSPGQGSGSQRGESCQFHDFHFQLLVYFKNFNKKTALTRLLPISAPGRPARCEPAGRILSRASPESMENRSGFGDHPAGDFSEKKTVPEEKNPARSKTQARFFLE